MTSPAVSVIVPAYNVAPYLNQCVDSVLHQTFADFELLLVDDGSTDATPSLCDAYAACDARVHVVHQANSGPSGARNAVLSLTRGEFVTFLDGDDWLESDTLEVSLQAAHQSRADVVLWPYVREYQGLSLPKRLFQFEQRVFDARETLTLCRRMVGPLGQELKNPENADALVTLWGKLYRRDLLVRSRATLTDTALIGTSEDALFNLQVLTYASSAIYVNRFLHHYRRDNASSITTLHKGELKNQWDTLHELMGQHIAAHALGPDFEQALRNRVSLSIFGLGLNALNSGSNPIATIQDLRGVLATREYQDAISTLDTRWLPLHWRVFYAAAKYRRAALVWALLWTINRLRAWRNRALSR